MSEFYDWRTPIRALVLKENYNAALIFPVDVRKKPSFELFFFRVARASALKREYVLPELTSYPANYPNVAGSLIDFVFLGELGPSMGDDIFTMSEERPFRILHFGIGVHPPELWVYRQQPAGYTVTAWSRRVPTKLGDPVDYFTGEESPFEEPTRISETVMWYKGSVNFAVVNMAPVSVVPKLNIVGAGYDVVPITDRAVADKMVKGVLPCRFISVGGLAEVKYTVPDEWKPYVFSYGLEDVLRLLR
ncbi:MAG: hypothetical protein ABIM77_08175 [candidate division WOR-3 bacterium]